MIKHEEAVKLVLSSVKETETELISVEKSLNRVLSQDLISEINSPPFDKSMVDGYACRREDINNELEVIGIIGAGDNHDYKLSENKCVKIMTGAPIPEGTDLVAMVEHVEHISENTIKIVDRNSSDNVSPTGEDIKIGDVVLPKGTMINPPNCGIIASLGCKDNVPVYSKVSIGIFVTGDEVKEPGVELEKGQIYNSNAYILMSSCEALNITPNYYGIIGDAYEEIESAFNKAIDENDIVIVTGGVSVGDYDFVGDIMKASGLEIQFDSVAAQPGRPLVYATKGNKYCFGMPGNPVSGFVIFSTIVKPFIYKMMGYDYKSLTMPFKLSQTIKRKKTSRKSFYPVKLNEDNTVTPISYHGSAHLNAYAECFGLLAMEMGISEINEGELVNVRQL